MKLLWTRGLKRAVGTLPFFFFTAEEEEIKKGTRLNQLPSLQNKKLNIFGLFNEGVKYLSPHAHNSLRRVKAMDPLLLLLSIRLHNL